MNKLLNLAVIISISILYSCNSAETPPEISIVNNDQTFGLITDDVLNEDVDPLGNVASYPKDVQGTSQRRERAFENAPPTIPHTTEGILIISTSLNMCITCHMPEIAGTVKSTPIPVSHLTEYRPPVSITDGNYSIEESKRVTEINLDGKLNMARYNCTQCHVPQANVDIAVQSKFNRVFRDANLMNHSNLTTTIKEGVK